MFEAVYLFARGLLQTAISLVIFAAQLLAASPAHSRKLGWPHDGWAGGWMQEWMGLPMSSWKRQIPAN